MSVCAIQASSTPATTSKQHCRSNATSRTILSKKSNVASTLLPVWTVLKATSLNYARCHPVAAMPCERLCLGQLIPSSLSHRLFRPLIPRNNPIVSKVPQTAPTVSNVSNRPSRFSTRSAVIHTLHRGPRGTRHGSCGQLPRVC